MYKGKKLGPFARYSNNPTLVIIIIISAICIAYVFIKAGTTSNATNRHPSHRGIHAGHYSAQIDYEAMLKDVDEQHREQCLNILQGKRNIDPETMWSLNFEDWFIYQNFFKDDSYHFHSSSNFDARHDRKGAFGIYLDIGSFQPFKQSTTAFFDVCLGWSGLCIWNPDLAVNMFFSSTRSCNTVSHECLWKPDSFFQGGHSDTAFCHYADRYIKDVMEQYQFHDRFGNQYARQEHQFEIDLVALRVEGAEAEFIKCFPFDSYAVKVWSISTIDSKTKAVDELLLANGYLKFEHLSLYGTQPSMIYVRRDAVYPWTEETKYQFHPEYECKMVTPDLHNN